ncbi:signal peptidase I SipW [Neobacillus cucumis]|uniref:signal peptidase I SipW n=1 Tax=Neobacillus cucumis TaxID=1740721 RepID=UPI00285370B2|nr:signal peptidase I [Neobacillus cucumis]MDR4948301.1 signal peptidase I [Neobacillus cucumis]
MRKINKWISKIVSFTIYGLLVCLVITLITSKISGGTQTFFGHEILTVLSGSMEPNIKTGSIISVTPMTKVKDLKKGDIITYKAVDAPNTLITHRIIKVQKSNESLQFITKGDNNDGIDIFPVPAANIVAQYDHFTIPFLGYLLSFVKSKLGSVLMLILPGFLLINWSISSIWKTIKVMVSKKEYPTK